MAILTPHPTSASGRRVLTPGVSISSHRRRVAQWSDLRCPGGEVRVVNVHLTARRADTVARAEEARLVAELRSGPATIVTGDLNTPGEPVVLGPLEAAGLHDVWRGPGPGFTNPSGGASQRLDYVLAGSAFEPISVTVPEGGSPWAELSDHLPVFATLRRIEPAR